MGPAGTTVSAYARPGLAHGHRTVELIALAAIAALIVTLMSGVFAAQSVRAQDDPPSGGVFSYAPNFEPDTLDPHVSAGSSSFVVINSVIETLLFLNPDDNEFYPYLAESWEVSEDGTTYTFKLREDVTFHDGTPFNAEAVKFNLDRIVDPETAAPYATTNLGSYTGSNVIDEYTVEVQLETPYPPLLVGLSQTSAGMISPTAAAELGPEGLAVEPVGTGFMRFESFVPKEKITFVRNEDYNWAPAVWGHSGPAYLDGLEFQIIPEPAARVTALESGTVLGIEDTPAQDVLRLQEDENFTLVQGNLPGAPRTFFMNTERAPLDDINVRKALLHGLNIEQIVQLATFGIQPFAKGPFAEATAFYNADAAKEANYPYDPELAGQLLDDAGWTMGPDGIRVNDAGEPLVLTAIGFPVFEALYTATQALAREIGVDVDVQIIDVGAAVEANQRGDHHLAMTGVVGADPSIIALLYHSRNYDGFAFSRWQDPAFDALWDDAAASSDPAVRAQLYGEAQQYIMDNALSIPEQEIVRLNFVDANVNNVRADASGIYLLLYDAFIDG